MHLLMIFFIFWSSHQLFAEKVDFVGSSDISGSITRAKREIYGLIMTGKHRKDDFEYEGSGQSDDEGSGDNEDDYEDNRKNQSPIPTVKSFTDPTIQISEDFVKDNEDFYLENDTLIEDHVIRNKTRADNTISNPTSGEEILDANIRFKSFAGDNENANRNFEKSSHTNTTNSANVGSKSDIEMFNELYVGTNAYTENHTSKNDSILNDETTENSEHTKTINTLDTDNNSIGKISSGKEKCGLGHFTLYFFLMHFTCYVKH